jgi:TonB-dependent SusC/RagA subfamily outer membrane receptor
VKRIINIIIVSSLLLGNSTFLMFGQERIVEGQVTTFESIALVNASIRIKSTREVVLSDSIGRFTVSCLPKDKLKVTARGFSSQNVKIGENIKFVLVNLKLKPGPENRELAIGYGHVKDKDKLDAVSGLRESDMDFSQYTDIYDLISGRFPGVEVRGNEIIIRGPSTFHGSDAALLIVDDIAVDAVFFGSIPTAQIRSINVIRGASASIYGVRGANGVVIVETKSGFNH